LVLFCALPRATAGVSVSPAPINECWLQVLDDDLGFPGEFGRATCTKASRSRGLR
jgi:hypothetical protein